MEFEDVIYVRFINEWSSINTLNFFISWEDFIKSKDLGVIFIKGNYFNKRYKIVDKNKWALAKIKYAI